MVIELKKLRHQSALSRETNAFTADVYINGKRAATAMNDGGGGCTFVQHIFDPVKLEVNPDTRKLVAEAEAYAKTQLWFTTEDGREIYKSLADVVDCLVMDDLKAKDQKKMEKKMETSLMWGVPGGTAYSQVTYKQPIATLLRTDKVAFIRSMIKWRKTFKPGEQFLNTNIPDEILKSVGAGTSLPAAK